MKKKTWLGLFVLIFFSILPQARCAALPATERVVLENGLTLIHFRDATIPAVSLELLVAAGSWRDPEKQKGLANLTAKSLLLGSRNLTYDQINGTVDYLGAQLDVECGKDFARLGMQILKKELDAGVDLVTELLINPVFPPAEVTREKTNITGKLRAMEDNPADLANRAFERALFLNSPYASDAEGTEASLAGIGPADLAAFYGSFYHPSNTVLVVGGDITMEEVKSRIVPGFLKWKAAKAPETVFKPEFAAGKTIVKIDRPISQASIVIGNPGLVRADKDYYAFSVLNQILGSGNLSSRLMVEVREKKGLAYSIQSVMLSRKHAGSFRIFLQTKNATAGQAVDLAVKEMKRMQNEPVSEEELKRAKSYLIGNFPLRYGATQQDYAKFLAQVEYYGLGLDYPGKYASLINAVTPQDLLRVAGAYLQPERNVLVVVGDAKDVQLQ
ncbi:MAG: insulinase family protein [Desulfobacteraceae bacterium]|nr:insulinase family protein [Desulfobacteraceae bacterium]